MANPNVTSANSVMDLTKEQDGGLIKRILRAGAEQGVHPTKGDTVCTL